MWSFHIYFKWGSVGIFKYFKTQIGRGMQKTEQKNAQYMSVMHESRIGIGFDSRMILLWSGIRIGFGIKLVGILEIFGLKWGSERIQESFAGIWVGTRLFDLPWNWKRNKKNSRIVHQWYKWPKNESCATTVNCNCMSPHIIIMSCDWNILGWDHPHIPHWCRSIVPPGLSYRFLLRKHDKVEWMLQLNGCLDSTSKSSYYRTQHHGKQSVTKLFPQNNHVSQAQNLSCVVENRALISLSLSYDSGHAKRVLMYWEKWGRPPSTQLPSRIICSWCHTKGPANPSFGMTTTKIVSHVFPWHGSNISFARSASNFPKIVCPHERITLEPISSWCLIF